MKIQKSAIICCFAAAGLLFASCKKDTPRTEQKVDNPSTPTTQPEKPTPPAPKPEDPKPPVPQPEAPKAAGEARIEVAKAGGLEAALKGEDLEKLTKLVVTSGSLNQADLNFITKSLKIQELDLTTATLKRTGSLTRWLLSLSSQATSCVSLVVLFTTKSSRVSSFLIRWRNLEKHPSRTATLKASRYPAA